MAHPYKGYTVTGVFPTRKIAEMRMMGLRHKFNHVKIAEGTKGEAWGKKRRCFRVLVK